MPDRSLLYFYIPHRCWDFRGYLHRFWLVMATAHNSYTMGSRTFLGDHIFKGNRDPILDHTTLVMHHVGVAAVIAAPPIIAYVSAD